ncbi:MAG: sigma-54-dependent Fis family transcriptional regulator, partial [Alistipes sp.]|nr:sigma-54-dependent Fis family transcriptional regulator [Alistipes sp.]
GGTIFLDEVGELPLSTQVRLLRVLQTGEFIRVGSARVQKTNVRVVAATNNNLLRAISEGRFREDLYYRLATVPITVPALRERPEDIYLLFRKFASDVAVRYHMPAITLDASARDMLERYSWPGNVRQLKNVAEQISAIESERVITASILERYLTAEHRVSAPSVAGAASFDDMNTEREILYKILFDMRADINEMKQMLYRMGGYGTIQPITPEPRQEVAALLPNPVSHQVEYAEEIIDENPQPATKADMQREQIVRALRRNGGSRRAAAAELFMSERTLYRRIKELGIEE